MKTRILLFILTAFLVTSPALAKRKSRGVPGMNCNKYGQPVKNPSSLFPQTIFTPEMTNEMFNEEDRVRGVGQFLSEMPKSYDEIFFADKDFPMSEIETHARESEQYWSSGPNAELTLELASQGIDSAVITDLNLAAAKAWKQLLACNGNNASQARRNYFLGNPCPHSAEANTAMIHAIAQVAGNMIDYATTSEAYVLNHNVNGDMIPNIHPLLTQIAFQNQVVFTHLPVEKMKNHYQSLDFALSELIHVKRMDRMNPGYGEAFSAMQASRKKRFTAEHQTFASTLGNLFVLTSKFVSNRCSGLGLWPAINRHIPRLYTNVSMASYVGESTMSSLGPEMNGRVDRACGGRAQDGLKMFQPNYGLYNSFAIVHFAETRRLMLSYAPLILKNATISNKLRQVARPEITSHRNLTPYQEALCTP